MADGHIVSEQELNALLERVHGIDANSPFRLSISPDRKRIIWTLRRNGEQIASEKIESYLQWRHPIEDAIYFMKP